jgi:hypothetical protein
VVQCDEYPGAISPLGTLDGVPGVHVEAVAYVADTPQENHQRHDPRHDLNPGCFRRREDGVDRTGNLRTQEPADVALLLVRWPRFYWSVRQSSRPGARRRSSM